MKILEAIGFLVSLVITVAVVACLLAFPVMWLWNWLMPYLFGLPTITAGQALGLYVLCNFLFSPKTTSTSKKRSEILA